MLQKRVEEATAPALVFQEADLSVRVVRDIFSAHFERAIVDDPKQHQRLVSFFARTAPELVDRVELWEEPSRLFEAYGVDPVIEGMLSRRVDLPSGGYLMIDYAEALTVIDVNTGSYTGKGKAARLEDTITRTNLEAAEEVVNQLRLRDIGGIIVIDFIDMARARNRDAVLKTLRKALDEDRTKTFVVEISPLGLVEMTRQNVTDGAREIMTKPCPTCDGEGVVKSEETIAIEVERRLRELVAEAGRRRPRGLPRADEPEGHRLLHRPTARACCTRSRRRPGRFFHFTGSEGLPLDHFAIVEEGARAEIEEQSVPFREGEEVHVDIVEPHMYSEDDAVAKVDGYLIEVTRRHRRTWARRCSCGSSRPAAPRAHAVLVEVAEEAAAASEERREARERAAKRAASARGARARQPSASRRRREEQAVEALTEDERRPRRAPARGRRTTDEETARPRAAARARAAT